MTITVKHKDTLITISEDDNTKDRKTSLIYESYHKLIRETLEVMTDQCKKLNDLSS